MSEVSRSNIQGRLYPHLLVLLASVLVAGSFIASDHLAGQINPLSLTCLRFFIATVCLSPVLFLQKDALRLAINIMPRAILLSFFYSAFFVGMFESLTITSTLNTATIYTLVPFMTALIAALALKEKMKFSKAVVYLLGAVGTLWVIFEGQVSQLIALDLNVGDLIFAGASISMCCYAVGMKFLYRNDPIWLFVWCTLLGAMIAMIVLMLLLDLPFEWHKLEAGSWIDVMYLALGTTLLTAFLYQKATVLLGPSKVTAYVYINPALVALLVFLIDETMLNWIILPGIIISALSMYLLLRRT